VVRDESNRCEVLDECCLVIPIVNLFQRERAEEGINTITCVYRIAVMWFENEVVQRKRSNELCNRLVCVVSEPHLRDNTNV